MLTIIKNLHLPSISFPRLFGTRRALQQAEAERDAAENRIRELERAIAVEKGRPAFAEVSRGFDASDLAPEVRQRVIEDLSPILSRAAVVALVNMMRGLEQEASRSARPQMMGRAAFDERSRTYEYRFDVPAVGTAVRYRSPDSF